MQSPVPSRNDPGAPSLLRAILSSIFWWESVPKVVQGIGTSSELHPEFPQQGMELCLSQGWDQCRGEGCACGAKHTHKEPFFFFFSFSLIRLFLPPSQLRALERGRESSGSAAHVQPPR